MFDFEKILRQINELDQKLKSMTFEQAYKDLHGFNMDNILFDFSLDINIIGTVYNKNGKPKLSPDSHWEYWDGSGMLWAMTTGEMEEQLRRTKE